MPLDLLVPRLVPPRDAPPEMTGLRLPTLERWLAVGDVQRVPAPGAHAWLAAEHGIGQPPPVAAIALASEGEPSPGAWLRADPVHIRIDRDAARLHGPAMLDIGRAEADALVATLQRHFSGDGLDFIAPSPERWYVRVPGAELPATTPLAEVLGRPAHGQFPKSQGAFNWHTALTEAQMLLAAHEVNARRETAGRLAVNSVWFWGEGVLPASVARRYDIVSGDAFARGLGAITGAVVSGDGTIPSHADRGARVLCVADALDRALERMDLAAWREAALRLEKEWFAAFPSLLERFGAVRLVVPGENATLVASLRRPSLLERFRAAKPLASYA